jgi:SAM-dependent methyltransferase
MVETFKVELGQLEKLQGDEFEAVKQRVLDTFTDLADQMNEVIGDRSALPPELRSQVGRQIQRELLPYLLLTEHAERYLSKPRGYAGDFKSIADMYANRPEGVGRLGATLDECFLETKSAKAVRNRRGLLKKEIEEQIAQRTDGDPCRVTSIACGPGAEIFDVFELRGRDTPLKATLIDIDFQALAYVADIRDRLGLKKHIQLHQGNLIHLALGRESIAIPPQDLIYSIGLVDYFDDEFVVALMNWSHEVLKPGGRAIFGNFHPRNPVKAMLEYVTEWELIHRTEQDMSRLYSKSAFGRDCTRVQFEDQGINLFAECVKAGQG